MKQTKQQHLTEMSQSTPVAIQRQTHTDLYFYTWYTLCLWKMQKYSQIQQKSCHFYCIRV